MNTKSKVSQYYLLAFSIGLVYLWFGTLKFFPNISPAEIIAKNTISMLTFQLIPPHISIILLAIWEISVGFFLIANIWRQKIVIAALVHMFFTFSPLFLFPNEVFQNMPFQLTILGQYIFKNLVIMAGLYVLYKTTTSKNLD